MKISSIALTIATAGSIVAAQPHKHQHRHLEKRDAATLTKAVPGAVVTLYKLGDKHIDYDEAIKGIAEHRYVVDGGALKEAAPSTTPTSSPTSTPNVQQQAASTTPTSSPSGQANNAAGSTSGSSSSTSSSTSSSASASSSASGYGSDSGSNSGSSGSSSGGASGGQGLDRDFDDGNVDCSHFPSDYGPIVIDWMKLGGWSGIQFMDGKKIKSTAIGGQTCTGDAMCSYACPPGYQKSQWPLEQPSTFESVGGLQCKNGKLHLTNPGLSKKLCIKGVGGVKIQNKLKKNSAVCRTDYPGMAPYDNT